MPARFNLSGAVKGLTSQMAKPLGEVAEKVLPSIEEVAGAAPKRRGAVSIPKGGAPAPAGAGSAEQLSQPQITEYIRGVTSGARQSPPTAGLEGREIWGYDIAGNPSQAPPTVNPLTGESSGTLMRTPPRVGPDTSVPSMSDPNTDLVQKGIRESGLFGPDPNDTSPGINPFGPGGVLEFGIEPGGGRMGVRSDSELFGGSPVTSGLTGEPTSLFGVPLQDPLKNPPASGSFWLPGRDTAKAQARMQAWAEGAKGMSFSELADYIVEGAHNMGASSPIYVHAATLLRDKIKELGYDNVKKTLVQISSRGPYHGVFVWDEDGLKIDLVKTTGLPFITAMHELNHAATVFVAHQAYQYAPEVKLAESKMWGHQIDAPMVWFGVKKPIDEIASVHKWGHETGNLNPTQLEGFVDMVNVRKHVIQYLRKYVGATNTDFSQPGKSYTPTEKCLIRALGRMLASNLSYQLGSTHEFQSYSLTEPIMQQMLSMIPYKNDESAMSAALKAMLKQMGITEYQTALVAAFMAHEKILAPRYREVPAVSEYALEEARNLVSHKFWSYHGTVKKWYDNASGNPVHVMVGAGRHLQSPKEIAQMKEAVAAYWAHQFIERGTLPTQQEMETLTPTVDFLEHAYWSPYTGRIDPTQAQTEWAQMHARLNPQASFRVNNPHLDNPDGRINIGKWAAEDYLNVSQRAREMAEEVLTGSAAMSQFTDALRTHIQRTPWAGTDAATQATVYSGLMHNTFGADAPVADAIFKTLLNDAKRKATSKSKTKLNIPPPAQVSSTGRLIDMNPGDPKYVRMEYSISNVTTLPKEKDGGFTWSLDMKPYYKGGLIVPIESIDNLTAAQVTPEMIAKFVEDRHDMISNMDLFKVGIYKFPGEDRYSIDLNIVMNPKHLDTAMDIVTSLGQNSLVHIIPDPHNPLDPTVKIIETGATGTNTTKLTAEQVRLLGATAARGVLPEFMRKEHLGASATSKLLKDFKAAYGAWKTGMPNDAVDAALLSLGMKKGG